MMRKVNFSKSELLDFEKGFTELITEPNTELLIFSMNETGKKSLLR